MDTEEEHEITAELLAEARRNPNGFVYKIAGEWKEDEAIPGSAIVGAWKVNERGNIVGNFTPNPDFDPKWKERRIEEQA